MIKDEIKQLKTGPRELRKFGVLVGGVLILLGFWCLYRHKPHYAWILYPGVVLLILGLAAPRVLKHIYIGWMTLAFLLGFLVSNVLLTIFFYLVMTPVGLAAGCMGKDFLERKSDANARTYWKTRGASRLRQPADYEQQF